MEFETVLLALGGSDSSFSFSFQLNGILDC